MKYLYLLSGTLLLLSALTMCSPAEKNGNARKSTVNNNLSATESQDFRYVLRYFIDPDFHAAERIPELVDFCKKGKIEEVMLFDNPEELFIAYPDTAHIDAWFAHAKNVRKALTENGISMSVNPWITLGHASRGRRFGEDQKHWVRMVGDQGQTAYVTPCPLDKHWQNHLADYYARIAKELDPVAIYLEDDFRLHNHEGMGFGGCFCELHLKRFSETVGQPVTQKELYEAILAPGKPHPWRNIWITLFRNSILEPAKVIQTRVHAANPRVSLGQMTSMPDVHSAEGRDWLKHAKTLCPKGDFPFRPHMPPYTEGSARSALPIVTRHTLANLDLPRRIYPELENSPRCGRYSKSAVYSGWECIQSAAIGAHGITINHFDMMGNGTSLDPAFYEIFAQLKPRLNAVQTLNVDDRNAEGVDILFSPEVATYMESKGNSSYNGLVANSTRWAGVFMNMGITCRFVKTPDASRLTAVSDQTLRAYSDSQIKTLLSNKLLLDITSLNILLERGFGEYTGVESVTNLKVESPYLCEKFGSIMNASWLGGTLPRMNILPGQHTVKAATVPGEVTLGNPVVRSTIIDAEGKVIAPGLIIFQNKLGGSVMIPIGIGSGSYYSPERKRMMFNLIQQLCPDMKIAAAMHWAYGYAQNALDAPIHIYRTAVKGGTLISLLNPSSDILYDVPFIAPDLEANGAQLINDSGEFMPAGLVDEKNGQFRFTQAIRPLDAAFLFFPSQK